MPRSLSLSVPPLRSWGGRLLLSALALLPLPTAAVAQMPDDGVQLGRGELMAGYSFSHDAWETYWEGTLQRTNGNIGTLTTESQQWFANYGLTRRINLMGMLPHVETQASQGVLMGMHGWQDLTVAAKFLLLDRPTPVGKLHVMGVGAGSLPVTNYVVDFYPLAIGSQSRRVTGRLTGDLQTASGWYLTATGAYTRRGDVSLDRPYYFTNGQFFQSDTVSLPATSELAVGGGFRRAWLITSLYYTSMRTHGGGDIRRQDMPFVSNRMNADRLSAMAMVPVPGFPALALNAGAAYTVAGRNVGQSTTVTVGAMYMFRFHGSATK